jgi:hypothetical protein
MLLNSAGGALGEIACSSHSKQGGHMVKILLTVAVLGSVGSFAGPSMAQGKQGEAFGSEVSSQCAHRRVMPPDPRDDCVRKLRSDAQLGYGQGGASASSSSDGQASGAGPGNGAGSGNGIGPGNGAGQGKGRR